MNVSNKFDLLSSLSRNAQKLFDKSKARKWSEFSEAFNAIGHLDQYMTQHSHIVKQSHCETVQVIILFDSNLALDLYRPHSIIPICHCGFSICTAGETVKQSTYSHWNRPWTVSQSKYIRRFEFWPIWGPKWPTNLPLRIYLLHTNKSSSNELISQVLGESSGNFSRKLTKTYLGAKRAQKFSPQEPFWTHLKVPIICL